ncbi:MAG: S-layer homology domain-containing protein, partial [Firmicutes bacterium]|nr:S-layer homology domain-containing protein [Bacillota bacterium]
MKKVLSIVLSIAMVVCLAPTMAFAATTSASQAAAAYSDTQGTACEGAVNVLTALKVVDGFTDGTYKPEQTVTRAQMAKLIVTALGVADYATAKTSKFVDMGSASWAIPYVEYAANLNIVNGVGNNKFNPNGLVTYEQAATMIVRALGFTDECNEMNGTWPAIYIQKATALGIFQDVQNGGAKSANRGDTAIMLYNALDVAEVYADKDGQTQYKKGYNGSSYLTMMDTLNKNGQSYYKVIESGDVDDALTNIAEYLGANAKVTEDENGNVLAVGDIKSTFLKGDISDDGKNIKVGDTNYSLTSAKYQIVNRETGAGENFTTSNSAVVLNINGETKTSGISEITSASAIKFGDKNVTIAAKVSGTTVKEIYSVSAWNSTNDNKVDESDIAQITSNKKLLGQKFIKDDEQKIDTTSFILNGVSSLDEIKADNVVYVYSNKNGEIKRVDVGTKTVTGTITKIDGSNIYIDGTKYKKASSKLNADFTDLTTAGDEVTVDLDYDGKIYKGEIKDSSTGTYAVVVDMSPTLNSGAISDASKIQLLTADGVKVFNVNGTKYSDNVDDNKGSAWGTKVTTGAIVKYTLNSSNEITKVIALNDTITPAATKYTVVGPTTKTVNKSGYIDSKKIADNATIFSVPTTSTTPTAFDYSKDDDLGTTNRATILDSTLNLATYVVDKDNNKVVAMIVSD